MDEEGDPGEEYKGVVLRAIGQETGRHHAAAAVVAAGVELVQPRGADRR